MHENHYQNITLHGEHFTLGLIQAKVVQLLHQAHITGSPWVHGKTLLYDAGSTCQRVRDIFKSQSHWRRLIESDQKGYYRLRLSSSPTASPPKPLDKR